MQCEEWITSTPFSMPAEQKSRLLTESLLDLSRIHAQRCAPYGRILSAAFPEWGESRSLSELPWLPVALFKRYDLLSIDRSDIFKTLTSSGTTGATVAKIYLDRSTAMLQTKALAAIMQAFLGPKRRPMLIIDTSSVIKDRAQFSARGAGILGMMSYGRDHFYALDSSMRLAGGLFEWLEEHKSEELFIFGFTYMVWQHFFRELEKTVAPTVDLKNSVLFHGGGWKKLQEESISNADFKAALRRITGLERVHNYYGMVEQVGGIFVECEAGYLHCPDFADVIIRETKDWREAEIGEQGVIQVLSILPRSYPGHSLLTEDIGVLRGVDACACGRKGKYFEVIGRVPRAELRGCSDTHAYDSERAA